MRSSLLFAGLGLVVDLGAQVTYTQTLPLMQSVYSWTTFDFTATPPTTGPGTLSCQWLACWMSGFGGNEIWIEFETAGGWQQVLYQGGNVSECTYLPASSVVSAAVLGEAIAFGGGQIHGRLRATDNCVAGWGCSFSSDPNVNALTLEYTAHEADFSVVDPGICPGSTVQFTDESINTPTSYAWSFPGGSPATSTLQNPVVQYAAPGTFDVTLIVSTVNGPDTLVRPGYITVHPPPLANAGVDEAVPAWSPPCCCTIRSACRTGRDKSTASRRRRRCRAIRGHAGPHPAHDQDPARERRDRLRGGSGWNHDDQRRHPQTGLGKKVVQRAMVALEKDGRIVRVRAKAANYSHQFHIKQSDNGQLTGAEPVGESSGSAQGYRGSI